MAKRRVNVKGVSRSVDRLAKDLKNLRKKPGIQAPKGDMDRLHRKLTAVKTLLNDCPDPMFRMFKAAAPAAKRTKTTRKRTRKAR